MHLLVLESDRHKRMDNKNLYTKSVESMSREECVQWDELEYVAEVLK